MEQVVGTRGERMDTSKGKVNLLVSNVLQAVQHRVKTELRESDLQLKLHWNLDPNTCPLISVVESLAWNN